MVYVKYVDGEEDGFETKKDSKPWEWIPDQQAYLIRYIEGNVIVPAAFIKRLKHIEVDAEK